MSCGACNHACNQGRACPHRLARSFERMNRPAIRRDRARDAARTARVVLLAALAIGIAVFLTQKVFPAVAWEVQNATIERY